jgi:nuclear pore complex protein Nup107
MFGYPFDIMHPDATEQDETALYEHRKTVPVKSLTRIEDLPDADHHAALVQELRVSSAGYYELQLIVRILVMFRDWRNEEAIVVESVVPFPTFHALIAFINPYTKIPHSHRENTLKGAPDLPKPDLSTIKHLLESIEAVFHTLISSITNNTSIETPSTADHAWKVRCAYIPEIVLAYLAVLYTAATFLKPEIAAILVVKAMEIANLVADDEHIWLQQVFVDTKRMRELVDALARISQVMLKLGDFDPKKSVVKKRGSKGETIRIWDLNAKDRL